MAAVRDIGGLRPLITVIGVLILITGAQTETIKGKVGQTITLPVTYRGDPTEITWRKDGDIVVDMTLKPRVAIVFTLLKDRASISDTGSLIIKNLIKGDSGLYTATVIQDGGQTEIIHTELIVFAQTKTITSEEGQTITLPVPYTGDAIEITWRKDGDKVGDIQLNPWRDPYLYILEDRATISDIGSLTIRDLIKGDSGVYTAEVIQDGGQTEIFRMELIVAQTKSITSEEGQTITLPVPYTGDARLITWRKDGNKVGKIQLNPWRDPYLYIPGDRASICDTGLTIRDLIKGDSGLYTAEVLRDGGQTEIFRTVLIVFEEKPSGGSIATIIIPVIILGLLIIIILGLLYYFRKAQTETIKAEEGKCVTLNINYRGKPTKITWKKNGNKVGSIQLNPPGDLDLYILQDRATISDTGSLIIRNLIKGDSGLYTAEVIQDGGQTRIIHMELIVFAQTIKAKVGETITLPVPYTGDTREIIWKKDGDNVGEMKPPGAPHMYILEDRASISDTGSLIIRDLIKEDSGLYTAKVIQDGGNIHTIRMKLVVDKFSLKRSNAIVYEEDEVGNKIYFFNNGPRTEKSSA